MGSEPPINHHFEFARDIIAHEKSQHEAYLLRQDEIRIETGQLDPQNTSRILRTSRSASASQLEKERKAKDTQTFISLLDSMRKQLADLREQMENLYEDLEAKYGQDNVIDGMAETYLSEDVLSGLKTDEDKLKALAGEFLNPDGSIKDQYKHLAEAQYIQAWHEAQLLEATLDKYENKTDLSLVDKQAIHDVAQNASLSANKGFLISDAKDIIKTEVDAQLDSSRENAGDTQTPQVIDFS